jgi:hypothetical protein
LNGAKGPARTGVAYLPLHGGKAPYWLFHRMVKLAREITLVIVDEFGPQEMLKRLSHPFWFQAFGCVLGFDWHSSGVTTTLCGALKEGLKGLEKELGIFVAGGKGRTSRETPGEIEKWGNQLGLTHNPWSMPAVWLLKLIPPPYRTATSFIIMFLFSPPADSGQ